MKLPPELEAEILRRSKIGPGVKLPDEEGASSRPAKGELVEPSFTPPATWVIPVATSSEVNGRDWRARSRRSDAAWKAVSIALGPRLFAVAPFAVAYHQGKPVRVSLTRLGGRKLDRSNLPTALKAVEDAVAFVMGADDGDARWVASWEQEPGGKIGVRVALDFGG